MSYLKRLIRSLGISQQQPPPVVATWDQPFESLRLRWDRVPVDRSAQWKTTDLLALSDGELLDMWTNARQDITTGMQFAHRGWYHRLYADSMRGKKVLDVGSGFAIDSITFAQHGAKVTFVDIAQNNLAVVKRLCETLGLKDVSFVLLESIESLHPLESDYDVIMAMGSLHHAPFDTIKPEAHELLRHLRIGGRWLQLAYPKTRWAREGRLPFDRWGVVTDGEGTPWAEWYDLPKLLQLLEPAQFEVVLCQEFHNSDFIWFDLHFVGWDGTGG